MKSRHSILLCVGYSLYLILGAAMFMFLEYEVDQHKQVEEPPERTRLKELALTTHPPGDIDEVLSLAHWLPKACGAVPNRTLIALAARGPQTEAVRIVEAACPHLHQENVTVVVSYPWSFIDALYFSMTVTTTIGYGHLSPTTAGGRIMCMLYSLVGIPLTGILLAWTSESFGELLYKLFKSKLDKEKQQSHMVIALATILYIAIGFLVFIFVPGAFFMALENWTYLEGIYYAYITLTTIGFGDFVTGKPYEGTSLYAYQIGVILWIMIGLGYWVMVASFITKALKSKRLHASVLRSADEVKKIMQQMGIKQSHDPKFLRQHSKATINLMIQLSNIMATQGGVENGARQESETPRTPGADSTTTTTTTTSTTTDPSSPSSPPPLSPFIIPGISTLFGPGFSRTTPFSNIMGPLQKEYIISQTPPESPSTFDNDMVETAVAIRTSSENSETQEADTMTEDGHGDALDLTGPLEDSLREYLVESLPESRSESPITPSSVSQDDLTTGS